MKYKKILVVTSRYPVPVRGGDKLRIFQIIKYQKKKNKVDLISIGNSKIQLQYWTEKGYHLSLACTPSKPLMPTAEDRLLEKTRLAMEAQPNWGVGCKTQRKGV